MRLLLSSERHTAHLSPSLAYSVACRLAVFEGKNSKVNLTSAFAVSVCSLCFKSLPRWTYVNFAIIEFYLVLLNRQLIFATLLLAGFYLIQTAARGIVPFSLINFRRVSEPNLSKLCPTIIGNRTIAIWIFSALAKKINR